jgi:hypothetical protein
VTNATLVTGPAAAAAVTMAGRRGKALLDRFFRLVEQVDPFADHPWLKHGGVILSR